MPPVPTIPPDCTGAGGAGAGAAARAQRPGQRLVPPPGPAAAAESPRRPRSPSRWSAPGSVGSIRCRPAQQVGIVHPVPVGPPDHRPPAGVAVVAPGERGEGVAGPDGDDRRRGGRVCLPGGGSRAARLRGGEGGGGPRCGRGSIRPGRREPGRVCRGGGDRSHHQGGGGGCGEGGSGREGRRLCVTAAAHACLGRGCRRVSARARKKVAARPRSGHDARSAGSSVAAHVEEPFPDVRADLLLQDRLPDSDTVAPRFGQYGPRQAS
jgi:hypothetical protein